MVTEAASQAEWSRGAHPLLSAVVTIESALDEAVGALAAGTDPAWLSATDQGLLLEGLARIEQRAAALKLTALLACDGPDGPDGIAGPSGARSAGDWLAHRLHLAPRRIGGEVRLAGRADAYPVLVTAMLAGEATADHARAVLDVVDSIPPVAELPDGTDADVHEQAAGVLTGLCRDHTPAQVTHLGRRVLELVAPDRADAIEAAKLERAEREARRGTRLVSRRIGEGLIRVTADIPALHASLLDTVLDTIANPHRSVTDQSTEQPDDGERLGADQRRGRAFCTLLESLDTTRLPKRHGTAVAVAVLVNEEKLRADLASSGVCATTTGVEVSLGEARRLMCQAGVWPAVMGGASVVLDAGRTQRLITGPVRRALEITHPTCQAQGCTIPAAWCDGHHRTPWSTGGSTSVADGALLCSHHHQRVHDPTYESRWHRDDSVTFHRRT